MLTTRKTSIYSKTYSWSGGKYFRRYPIRGEKWSMISISWHLSIIGSQSKWKHGRKNRYSSAILEDHVKTKHGELFKYIDSIEPVVVEEEEAGEEDENVNEDKFI
jgi:hypothetical protein